MDFEIPSWKSNWDFEEFTVDFTVRFTTEIIIHNITPKNQIILFLLAGKLVIDSFSKYLSGCSFLFFILILR